MTTFKKIEKENVENISALSPVQEGLLYHYIRYREARSYFVRLFLFIKGEVDFDTFKDAWGAIVEKNEMLRTVFRWQGIDAPIQITLRRTPLRAEFRDLSKINLSFESLQKYLDQNYQGDDVDLAETTFRVVLYSLGNNKFAIEIKTHHILYDGWSNGILIREFFTTYNTIARGDSVTFLPKARFSEYVQKLKQADKADALQYWQTRLGSFSSINGFQDRANPDEGSKPEISRCFLKDGLSEYTNRFSSKNRLTSAAVFYTAWGLLMAKLANSDNFLLGTTVSGRNVPLRYIENTVGLFINTVPLTVSSYGNDSFFDVVRRVSTDLIDREPYVNCPVTELKNLVSLKADDSLFQTLVVIENYPFDMQTISQNAALTVESYEMTDYNDYNLYLVVNMLGLAYETCIYYNPAKYSAELIQKIQDRLGAMIEVIVTKPESLVSDFHAISLQEKDHILQQFNDTAEEFSGPGTLHELFAEQVQRTPDAKAVVLGEEYVTYSELDHRSNQLANLMIDKGVKHRNVGIIMDTSFDTIVSILAVLKSGNAYVPIDGTLPAKRISWLIKDVNAVCILSQVRHIKLLNKLVRENDGVEWFVCLDDFEMSSAKSSHYVSGADVQSLSPEPVRIKVDQENIAYVIYTSGSTGNPKGVKVRHRGVVNYTKWRIKNFNYFSNDNTLQLAPYNFDTYGSNLYSSLFSGGSLVLVSKEDKLEPQTIISIIVNNSVTNFCITPMLYGAILERASSDELSGLRFVVLAGEKTSDIVLEGSKEMLPDVLLINEYGPTEASIAATFYKSMSTKTASIIGKPISNTEIYILGLNNELQQVKVEGEICIGGAGVAAGYINNEQLTEQKFVNNPFRRDEKMYRTGDLGRWHPDGNIEFLGRMDDQVKIRGFRIELGEIESHIRTHNGVKDAIVVAREREGMKYLVAYYVPDDLEGYTTKKTLQANKVLPMDVNMYEFSNGVIMYSRNKKEAQLLYEEIFLNNSYVRNGITLPENGCILDVGANIGMFSIYANLASRGLSIYCFEPIPPTFELLKLNVSLYKGNFELFDVGLSDSVGTKTFDYFPHATTLSGVSKHLTETKENVRQFIKNTEDVSSKLSENELNKLLVEKLETVEFKCKVTTVSNVIAQRGLQRIDLLKIDAENSELDVLNGIGVRDWDKIDQLVIEVHNVNNRLEIIKQLLIEKGYQVIAAQATELENTNLHEVFAISPRRRIGLIADYPELTSQGILGITKFGASLKKHLMEDLPEYMVPAYYAPLETFPLTPNGKIDKRALPDPEVIDKNNYVAPSNEIEMKLVEILGDILRLDKEVISIEKGFFDLGGDSLKAINLVSQIEKKFGTNIRLDYIFESPSIKHLSNAISISNLAASESSEANRIII